jgi:hypothetical protein
LLRIGAAYGHWEHLWRVSIGTNEIWAATLVCHCTINGPVGRSESDRSFYNPFRTDFIRDVAISQRGDMGRVPHKTSVDPLRILPTFNSNPALPQTDEVYAEDGALIAIANK